MDTIYFRVKYISIILFFITLLGVSGFLIKRNLLINSEHTIVEGTVVNKFTDTKVIPSEKGFVSTMEYNVTADIAGSQYGIRVSSYEYDEISIGDNLMFNVFYDDDRITSVSIASAADLTEPITAE